tara:strand:- start:132 stop:809 length:678 start_codon:yes stop_codon:yes gene_type:complete
MSWGQLTFDQQTKVRLLTEEYIREKIPGFEIIEKSESLWMKILSKILFFTPDFMERFVTTFYPKVYVPSKVRWEANNFFSIITLTHEYVHLADRKRLNLLFNFLYLSPQVLVVFALLYPINLWFLLFLLCLLPIPSLGRAWAEFRGYRMSMATYYWLTGERYSAEFMIHQFISSNYYWMFPFRGILKRAFDRDFKKVVADDLSPELREIKNVLTTSLLAVYNKLI